MRLLDSILLIFAIGAPVYCVLRLNLFGVFVGGFVQWATLIFAGVVLTAHRGSSILDGIWIMFGWMVGLFYCSLIFAVKLAWLRRRAPRLPVSTGDRKS
jgi:hypothetical protein